MPIRSFLKEAAFDPETIHAMSEALETACQALETRNNPNIGREIIAKKIIEVALDGDCDPARLRDAALRAVAASNGGLPLDLSHCATLPRSSTHASPGSTNTRR
jgi:hypothetical protein